MNILVSDNPEHVDPTRQHQNLTLGEGLEILLQAEQLDQEQRRYERLKKNAKFCDQASLEELQIAAACLIDNTLIVSLATGEYIKKGQSFDIGGFRPYTSGTTTTIIIIIPEIRESNT